MRIKTRPVTCNFFRPETQLTDIIAAISDYWNACETRDDKIYVRGDDEPVYLHTFIVEGDICLGAFLKILPETDIAVLYPDDRLSGLRLEDGREATNFSTFLYSRETNAFILQTNKQGPRINKIAAFFRTKLSDFSFDFQVVLKAEALARFQSMSQIKDVKVKLGVPAHSSLWSDRSDLDTAIEMGYSFEEFGRFLGAKTVEFRAAKSRSAEDTIRKSSAFEFLTRLIARPDARVLKAQVSGRVPIEEGAGIDEKDDTINLLENKADDQFRVPATFGDVTTEQVLAPYFDGLRVAYFKNRPYLTRYNIPDDE